MEQSSIIGTLLLIFTGLISYKGFRDEKFMERYCFEIDGILLDRQFDRMISSGFLHSGWFHFAFNMIALLSFSFSLELLFGPVKLLAIYMLSMLGGSLLALYIHRNHGDYSAIGASGAVSGVIFSSIILYPDSTISFVIIPVEIKAWILGILFVIISILGIKSSKGNIGHDAHLGGALTGILITLVLDPQIALTNWWIVLLLLVPTIAFLILIIRNPKVLMIWSYWGEDAFRLKTKIMGTPKSKQEELDDLLEKIQKKGYNKLSKKEKERLQELRNEL